MPIGFVNLYAVASVQLKVTKPTRRCPDMPIVFVNLYAATSVQLKVTKPTRRCPDIPIGSGNLYAVASVQLKVTKPTGNITKTIQILTNKTNTDDDAVLICLLALLTYTRSPVFN